MKLFRWRENNKTYPGIMLENEYFDLSSFINDFDENFFSGHGMERLNKHLLEHKSKLKNIGHDISFAAPVARPSKIIGVGLNYSDHAKETNAQVPTEPIIFLKSTTAICGPYDNVIIPRYSKKTDWEVELAFVIGKKASYVNEDDALDFIAGYCIHNDISEREFQIERGGTWDKGKGCDTFAPLGPFLVTTDEIIDVNNLKLWLKVNDQIVQQGSTANLIFKIPFLISYISQFMTLLPGDIISTGTPAGVGLGMNPPWYLKHGDVMELGIDGLGISRQQVISYDSIK